MMPNLPAPADTELQGNALDQLLIRFKIIAGCCLIGLIVGFLAVGFLSLVGFLTSLWSPDLPNSFSDIEWRYSPLIGAALLISSFITGQLLKLLDNGRPHGPADLINATQNNSALDLRHGYLSSFVALINLSGGASVGIFGPIVHFGGCISASMQKLVAQLPRDVLLASGACAGIAAVFHAPLGAAIFAHEAISRRFGQFGAGPALAAAFAALWVSEYFLGDLRVSYFTGPEPGFSSKVLFTAVGLGVASGILSSLYIYIVTSSPKLAQASRVPLQYRPLVPAIVLFLISPMLPHLLGTGIETIQLAMAGKLAISLLAALVIAKILMTGLCLGFGYFGGVFGPALFFGTLLGGVVDLLVTTPDSVGTSYAMLGAVSCVAAVIGAPFASIVIIFEVTRSYGWTVLSIISVILASQISRSLVGRSIFDRQLSLRGISVGDDRR